VKIAWSGVRSASQNVPLRRRPRTGGSERGPGGAVAGIKESFLPIPSLRFPISEAIGDVLFLSPGGAAVKSQGCQPLGGNPAGGGKGAGADSGPFRFRVPSRGIGFCPFSAPGGGEKTHRRDAGATVRFPRRSPSPCSAATEEFDRAVSDLKEEKSARGDRRHDIHRPHPLNRPITRSARATAGSSAPLIQQNIILLICYDISHTLDHLAVEFHACSRRSDLDDPPGPLNRSGFATGPRQSGRSRLPARRLSPGCPA
jgi:hypothetical protein